MYNETPNISPTDDTLTGTIILDQSGLETNGNKEVMYPTHDTDM